jgi:hypothetical protein
MAVGTSVRIYDLAKDLKQDTKRVIEELRREGADVSVPSNSVSKELADKIRGKYFPKTEASPKRAIKVIKKETVAKPEQPVEEVQPVELALPEVPAERKIEREIQPASADATPKSVSQVKELKKRIVVAQPVEEQAVSEEIRP